MSRSSAAALAIKQTLVSKVDEQRYVKILSGSLGYQTDTCRQSELHHCPLGSLMATERLNEILNFDLYHQLSAYLLKDLI